MSYDNRQEDIDQIHNLKIGEYLELNFFQEGGSVVYKVSPHTWELHEVTPYGISEQFYDNYHSGEIKLMVDVIYDELI